MPRTRITIVLMALALGSRLGGAGIVDTPLPVLDPMKPTLHLYSVPGMPIAESPQTYFACTSTDTSPLTIGIEVFNSSGFLVNDATATAVTLNSGETRVFGLDASPLWPIGSGADIYPHVDLGVSQSTWGSARILSTSKKVACNAFAAVPEYSPPTMMHLTIIRKTVQKASN